VNGFIKGGMDSSTSEWIHQTSEWINQWVNGFINGKWIYQQVLRGGYLEISGNIWKYLEIG
jgi:hypothetical protein